MREVSGGQRCSDGGDSSMREVGGGRDSGKKTARAGLHGYGRGETTMFKIFIFSLH